MLGVHNWGVCLRIQSDSLVAGVIVEKKFTYGVLGDIVKTASCMESSSYQPSERGDKHSIMFRLIGMIATMGLSNSERETLSSGANLQWMLDSHKLNHFFYEEMMM